MVPVSVVVRSAGVLVTRNLQPSLWDSVLPPEVRRLSPLLAQVDRWLDNEAFFAPFRPHLSALLGRPSIPMETYLRMMFLKFQYRLGYESLCQEVGDSISWRIFCRLNLARARTMRCRLRRPCRRSPPGAVRTWWPGSTRRCWRGRTRRGW
jgi:hypothetical protein